MKRSFCTAAGLSSVPPSTYRLQVVQVANLADLPGQEHWMYCRSRPRYRFDLGRILAATFPGTACPGFTCAAAPPRTVSRRQADRFVTLRCVQLPCVCGCYQCSARPLTSYQGSMPDVPRMTEGHHLGRREASLTTASTVSRLRSTGPPRVACPTQLWCAIQRARPCHPWRRSDRAPAGRRSPNPASDGCPSSPSS